MKILQNIDTHKLRQLIIGIVGIYATYLIGGVLHEYILKEKYTNRFDGTEDYFGGASVLVTYDKLVSWIFGAIYNRLFLQKDQRKSFPIKNSLMCAFTIFISGVTNNYAMIFISYPIVMMFKSCNILSVILIGVLCSRVTDHSVKLGGKKIIIAIFLCSGIVLFKLFDPQAKIGQQQKIQYLGLVLLFISLLADGFLPDFQAQIKQKFKPQPSVMMVQINKWCFIVSFVYAFASGEFLSSIYFMWSHPLVFIHLTVMVSLNFFGQLIIYNMIKNFKQHIVPFVITTRKILTIGISLVYYNHESSILQILGLLIVFITTLYEFIIQITVSPEKITDLKSQNQMVQQISPNQNNKDEDKIKHLQKQMKDYQAQIRQQKDKSNEQQLIIGQD